jgi:hypothetical protein
MQVAIWTIRYHSPSAWLEEDEQSAVRMTKALEDSDECSVLGVQFEDGRLISSDRFDEWEAYASYVEPVREPHVLAPSRKVIDPFNGYVASVDLDSPVWLGKQG